MSKPTLYLSFDVETDGPCVILNNMLSIGFYGLDDNCVKHFEYEVNLYPLEGHVANSSTMKNFWLKPENKEAYDRLKLNRVQCVDAMKELSDKFFELSKTHNLIFVAHPAAFDWQFFKNYWGLANDYWDDILEVESSLYDIGYSCQCSSTLWNMVRQKNGWSSNQANTKYKEISDFNPDMEHYAIDDARRQGIAYVKMKQMLM
jgi:hypothetical protein